jgi:class 3 adenylate cyclase/predicted ATPase
MLKCNRLTTMRCPRCHAENREGRRFCGGCGLSLAGVCPSCGFGNEPHEQFCGGCGERLSMATTPAGGPAGGERRQLTVMFCDLVGSTALSQRLDPEDWRTVVRDYQRTCTAVIERFEGQIAQYLGDGLLIYFGYPQAHEDDARRAVQAGLDIVAALQAGQRAHGEGERATVVEARIGIDTGRVVVGDVGDGGAAERLALGETPNVAARLQSIAEPNAVVISSATSRLVSGFFECQDLGPQALKGLSASVHAYRVIGASGVQHRLGTTDAGRLTPLVGRDEEVAFLQRRWQRATAGDGQVVLVSGEPGIGKSRLVRVLTEHLAGDPHGLIEWRCSPYYQNSAFYPVIEGLHRRLRFGSDDAPEDKVRKLETALGREGFDLAAMVPLLGALLSLPLPERYPPLTIAPERQKQRTLDALVAWVRLEAARQPMLLVVEDLHWIDPSTLELLELIIDQLVHSRLLQLLTFRPDFHAPWPMLAHVTQLTLSRLGHRDVEAMVESLVCGEHLTAEMRRQLIARTDGVPLFVEELTKAVMESDLAIPASLHDSLMARLDRLANAKEIAQLGAALGREFTYELIRAVSPVDELALQQALGRLVDAGLLYQRGLPPQSRYVFKHALIQDAAYESLLKTTRQHYHRQIACALDGQGDDAAGTPPELLAHHYTEAGLLPQALPHWQRAGEQAVQRSANLEAISHFNRGLQVLRALPDTTEHARRELALQVSLGVPLRVAKGFADPDVGRAYTRARELCSAERDTVQLFSILRGLWEFHELRGEYETALDLARQLITLAERGGERAELLVANEVMGDIQLWLGDFDAARRHTEHAFALYDRREHDAHVFRYGYDLGVASLAFGGWALWFLGYPEGAMRRAQEAAALAREQGHPFTLAFALLFMAQLHSYRRDAEPTRELTAEVMAFSSKHNFPMLLHQAAMIQGWALAEQGHPAEAIAQIEQGLREWKAMGQELECSHFLGLLAEAHARAGRPDEGLAILAEALSVAHRIGEGLWEAELYRLRGELLLATDSPSRLVAADESFQKAISAARARGAKAQELRATISLARLWQQRDRRDEARQALAEIYRWFAEGLDTRDLTEARTLLDALTDATA